MEMINMSFEHKMPLCTLITVIILAFSAILSARIINVLIVSGHTDKYHNWQVKSQNYKALLAKEACFNTIELVLSDTNAFNLPSNYNLNKYDVIVLDINYVKWNNTSKISF